MLSAVITNKAGTTATYSSELINLSISTRNNEGVGFNVTMPSLVGALTLLAVDTFTKSLRKGDKVKVTSTVAAGLTFSMTIITVTNLEKKGKCEISCAQDFFEETSSVKGVLRISAGTWGSVQSKYGLGKVEAYENVPETLVNMSQKSDIPLAIGWNFISGRRNIAVTPFTTHDGKFAGEGLGMFKNAKPRERDSISPVYLIEAQNLIDYEIESAQPMITHLKTSGINQLEMQPIMPKISMPQSGMSILGTNLRGFNIPEKQLSAVYYVAENEDGTIAKQEMKWGDGYTTKWDASIYTTRKKIIAIFEDAFAEVTSANEIKVFKRDSVATALATFAVTGAESLVVNGEIGVTNSIGPTVEFQNQAAVSYAWFNKISSQHYAGIWRRGTNWGLITTLDPNDGTSYYFAGSQRAIIASGSGTDRIKVEAFYTNNIKQKLVSVYTSDIYVQVGGSVALPDVPSFITNETDKKALHFIGSSRLMSTEPIYVLWYTKSGIINWATRIEKIDGSTVTQEQVDGRTRGGWLILPSQIEPKYGENEYLLYDANQWKLFKNGVLVANDTTIMEWQGVPIEEQLYSAHRGNCFLFGQGPYQTLEALLIDDALPFISRSVQRGGIEVQVDTGNKNVVELPFRIGSIQQNDLMRWDSTLGKVELDVARFAVRDNSQADGETFTEKDVQALNIPAVGSYAIVKLSPSDELYSLVKIIGCSVNYEGVIKLKVSGIVVEQDVMLVDII